MRLVILLFNGSRMLPEISKGPMDSNTVIITCSSLQDHVEAAQKSQHTQYPVWIVDRLFHMSPPEMKTEISRIFYAHSRPETLLVAMGHCGGVWENALFPCRVVIPKADDCVTLLLSTDDLCIPNRKEMRHLYIYEKDPEKSMALSLVRDLAGAGKEDSVWGDMEPEEILQLYFHNYHFLDVIDTGLTDSFSPSYDFAVKAKAELIGTGLTHVPGSIRILEKLVSGQWDDQFLVLEPGKGAAFQDFFG